MSVRNIMSEISLSQEEAANYVKILVNALGSKYVDVYRSEPSVKNGGELKRLDRFQVMGAVWNVIDDDHYACYGNAHGYFRWSDPNVVNLSPEC